MVDILLHQVIRSLQDAVIWPHDTGIILSSKVSFHAKFWPGKGRKKGERRKQAVS